MEGIRLVFLGPPGAGKGTQADYLKEQYGIEKISTGDILREAVRNGSKLGKLAASYMEKGELVPDNIILSLVKERISKLENFVLDGFPRTTIQAEGLDSILRELKKDLKAVIYFDIDEEKVIKRLTSRRVCPRCGAVYNLITNPPKNDEVCDYCGAALERRKDDNEATVRNRLQVYKRDTLPLVDFYEKKGLLKKIDADRLPEEVLHSILGLLRNDIC